MTLPRLHLVTNDRVLSEPSFLDRARRLMAAHGPAVALHLRAPDSPVRTVVDGAESLMDEARSAGTPVLVNDRPDVALALTTGVQLGGRSIPVMVVRSLLGEALIGYSAHSPAEAAAAIADGASFAFIGTIWETASHPGRPGAGTARVREAASDAGGPVLAIGGVTPERAAEATRSGAWGVAVIRGVWDAADPVAAAGSYLEQMGVVTA